MQDVGHLRKQTRTGETYHVLSVQKQNESPKTKMMVTERDFDMRGHCINIMDGRKWHGPRDPPRGHYIWALAGVPRLHAWVVEQNNHRGKYPRARPEQSHRRWYRQISQGKRKLSNARLRERRASLRRDNNSEGNNRGAGAKHLRNATTKVTRKIRWWYTRNHHREPAEVCKCWTRDARRLNVLDELNKLAGTKTSSMTITCPRSDHQACSTGYALWPTIRLNAEPAHKRQYGRWRTGDRQWCQSEGGAGRSLAHTSTLPTSDRGRTDDLQRRSGTNESKWAVTKNTGRVHVECLAELRSIENEILPSCDGCTPNKQWKINCNCGNGISLYNRFDGSGANTGPLEELATNCVLDHHLLMVVARGLMFQAAPG